MNARPAPIAPRRPSAGVAALTMVMVLFFVMAMVAAYTNRNLIYEQRVSSNNYRATAATSAAEAGVDWAVAMLSGGRIDASCAASTNAADNDFRSRYVQLQADGSYTQPTWSDPVYGVRPLVSACVLTQGGWNCDCPNANSATLANVAGIAPVFRVEVLGSSQPGLVTVRSRGCANISSDPDANGDPNYVTACHRAYLSVKPRVDGVSDVEVELGLARALPVPPVAALTAANTIAMNGGNVLTVVNADPKTAVTIHTGRALSGGTSVSLKGPPGSRAPTDVVADAQLDALQSPPAGEPGVFQSIFGMDPATFSRQPAAVYVDCNGGCNSANIASALANHPKRIVWVAGDVNIDTPGTLGSAAEPLMLVASGDVTLSAPVTITGLVYGRDITWQPGAGGSTISGAVVAGRNVQGHAPLVVAYDADVLQRISLGYGSFVRVPGSWHTTPLQ